MSYVSWNICSIVDSAYCFVTGEVQEGDYGGDHRKKQVLQGLNFYSDFYFKKIMVSYAFLLFRKTVPGVSLSFFFVFYVLAS
jgi:hypothetical protein